MFSNLIESVSHRDEFKRKGAFFTGTLAIYGVLFFCAGIASVYAYNAHVDQQNLDVLAMVTPVNVREMEPEPPRRHPNSATSPGKNQSAAIRTEEPPSNIPWLAPKSISSNPLAPPPVPTGVDWKLGDRNAEASPFGSNDNSKSTTGTGGDPGDREPPPVLRKPEPKPAAEIKTLTTSRVMNGEAKQLPKPRYPQPAIAIRAGGTVSVQVLIDEYGRVVSAKAVSGHPLLRAVAVEAAYLARFSPTKLNDEPVKVSGFINYNFILNQ